MNGISSAGGSLGTPRSDSNSRAISRHLGTTWATVRKPPIQVTKPAALTPLWKREVPQLQQDLPGTASLPHRLCPQGGPTGGGSSVAHQKSPHTTIASVSLNLRHEMGDLSHLLYYGLFATMALQRTHLLHHSCLAQANQAPT